MPDFKFAVTEKDIQGVTVVAISGSLDSNTSVDFRASLQTLIQKNNKLIIVDFSKLDYISSAGIGLFMEKVDDLLQIDGDLKFAAVPPKIMKVLEMMGLPKVIEILPDIAAAKNSLLQSKQQDLEQVAFPLQIACPTCQSVIVAASSDLYTCGNCFNISYIDPKGKISAFKKSDLEDKKQKLDLTFPCELRLIPTIRQFIGLLSLQAGFSQDFTNDFELAVDEAVNNVMEHSLNWEKSQNIKMEITIDADRFSLTLIDHGKPYEYTQIEDDSTQAYKDRGRGRALIKRLVDEVEHFTAPGKENRLTLVKYFKKIGPT